MHLRIIYLSSNGRAKAERRPPATLTFSLFPALGVAVPVPAAVPLVRFPPVPLYTMLSTLASSFPSRSKMLSRRTARVFFRSGEGMGHDDVSNILPLRCRQLADPRMQSDLHSFTHNPCTEAIQLSISQSIILSLAVASTTQKPS